MPDEKVIVDERMPDEKAYKNVSSHFILKQEFKSKHDLSILNNDQNAMAVYLYFAQSRRYPYTNPPRQWPRWSPTYEMDVGLMVNPPRFETVHLERHLFRQEDPIQELEKMSAWLARSLEESLNKTCTTEERKMEASIYVNHRLENIKMERWFCEEHGGCWGKFGEEDDIDDSEPMG